MAKLFSVSDEFRLLCINVGITPHRIDIISVYALHCSVHENFAMMWLLWSHDVCICLLFILSLSVCHSTVLVFINNLSVPQVVWGRVSVPSDRAIDVGRDVHLKTGRNFSYFFPLKLQPYGRIQTCILLLLFLLLFTYTQAISECFRDKRLIIKCYINSSVYFTYLFLLSFVVVVVVCNSVELLYLGFARCKLSGWCEYSSKDSEWQTLWRFVRHRITRETKPCRCHWHCRNYTVVMKPES